MAAEEKKPDRRVLVVGHDLRSKTVASCVWDNVGTVNLVEYDDVILDMVPFQMKRVRDTLGNLINRSQVIRHVTREQTRTIVIGSPNPDAFAPGLPDDALRLERIDLPVNVRVIREGGSVIEVSVLDCEGYFRQLVTRTSGYLELSGLEMGASALNEILGRLGSAARTAEMELVHIAETRAGEPIAFGLKIKATGDRWINRSSPVMWLPQPTEGESIEGVMWILKNMCGVLLDKPEPEWAALFQMPEEAGVRAEMEAHDTTIATAVKARKGAEERFAALARFRKALYEQDDILEEVVRDVLEELEAKVNPAAVKGREDGRAVDPCGRNYMLEIKGRTGTLRLQDVRQLDQWVQDANEEKEPWTSKGLLIVNLQLDLPPSERKDTVPPNCLALIKRNGFCVVTTAQLFQALVERRRGTLDLTTFWDTLHGTVGVASLAAP